MLRLGDPCMRLLDAATDGAGGRRFRGRESRRIAPERPGQVDRRQAPLWRRIPRSIRKLTIVTDRLLAAQTGEVGEMPHCHQAGIWHSMAALSPRTATAQSR